MANNKKVPHSERSSPAIGDFYLLKVNSVSKLSKRRIFATENVKSCLNTHRRMRADYNARYMGQFFKNVRVTEMKYG